MSVDHYENFPIASVLLPPRVRAAVATIYRFARAADDLADEGDAAAKERLAALDRFRRELDRIGAGEKPELPVFVEVQRVVTAHALPLQPLHDLLDAFSQDVVKTRYRDFPELLEYCRRSANPIGRILLALYGAKAEHNVRSSDAICTGLQLINFWQDVAIDWRKGRVYLPQDELERFGVSEAQIAAGRCDTNWQRLMAFQAERAGAMMIEGSPLASDLPGRIGLELRMIVAGGLRILEKLMHARGDVFRRRPILNAFDWPLLLWRAATATQLRPRSRP
jgi:squalene synthase HpnC